MESRAAAETLYSALIQGGATLMAVVGGFLLNAAITYRASTRSLEATVAELTDLISALKQDKDELLAELKTAEQSWRRPFRWRALDMLYLRLPPGFRSHKYVPRREEMNALRERVGRLDAQLSRVNMRLEKVDAAFDHRTAEMRIISKAGWVLFLLILACVYVPSFALSVLASDSDEVFSFRQACCLVAYVLALVRLVFLAKDFASMTHVERKPTRADQHLNGALLAFIIMSLGAEIMIEVTKMVPSVASGLLGST